MKIVILDRAKHDLKDGYDFYESQDVGVGRYFLDSLYTDIESLQVHPEIYPEQFGRYHRMIARRFPFGIYYMIREQEVRIHAVLDLRRSTRWIRKRLRGL